VTGAAKVALDLLRNAIAESGELGAANGSSHIPPDTRTISETLWREHCYRGMFADSDKPDTKRKTFVRAAKRLQELGLAGIWADRVWMPGHAGHRPDK
jgi:hypothetical protein